MATYKTKEKRKAIELMKQGKTNKEISRLIGISEKTLGIWLRPIKKDYKAKTTTQRLLVSRLNILLMDDKLELDKIERLVNVLKKIKGLKIN